MKKIYLTLTVVFASLSFAFSQQPACIIDQTNTDFFAPTPDSFPCIERTVLFSNAIQISVPASYTVMGFTATVDSVVITGVTGLPTNMSYACNPASCSFPGGTNGCINFEGTTSDPAGPYTATFAGTAYVQAPPPIGAQAFSLSQLAGFGGPQPTYGLDVIEPGAGCRTGTGINAFNADLNSAIYVYPNPSTGVIEFVLDAGRRINGEIVVVDITGKRVFVQALDVVGLYNTTIDLAGLAKGLYTVQLRTAEGFASKNISIE